jgi:hypothetical protein
MELSCEEEEGKCYVLLAAIGILGRLLHGLEWQVKCALLG